MEVFANNYTDFGIYIPPDAKPSPKNEVDTICPQCDHLRKHKGEKKLRVNIEKGTWFCAHCSWTGGLTPEEWAKNKPRIKPSTLRSLEGKQLQYWINRKISEKTLVARMVKSAVHPVRDKRTGTVSNVLCTVFTYYQNGWPTMIKYRDGKKNFAIQKDSKLIPWGLDYIKGKNDCIIVEGEPDVLSFHEVGLINCVSVPNGATISSEERDSYEKTGKLVLEKTLSLSYFDNCYEDFETKKCIYIATDADAAGVKLRLEIARRFGTDKCKFIDFSKYTYLNENGDQIKCKDANEVLKNLGPEVLKNTVKYAENFPIEDVVTIDDVWSEIEYQSVNGLEYGVSTGIPALDPHFTWKLGHTVVINAHNNMGKTTFGMYLILLSSVMYGWKWGVYSPENYPVSDLAVTLLEMYMGNTMDPKANKPATKNDLEKARTFLRNHIEFVNNEDGYTPEKLREVKRQMILRKGINGFFTDPWNSLYQNLKGDTMDNYLTHELSAEVRFAVNNKIISLYGVHPMSPISIERREPRPPSEFEITGGAIWSKKMYEIMTIHYDKKLLSSEALPLTQVFVHKTKDHRLIGVPNKEEPVLLKFNPRSHRYLLSNGTDCFESAKQRVAQTQIWENF